MSEPDVSVVVPTYNRADLIAETVASLADQSLPRERFDVLVVDNASSDATAEIAERALQQSGLRGRLLREETLGANFSRNRGIEESSGAIVALLDDDARADRNWLEALLAAFEDGTASGVGGRIELLWQTTPPRWCHRNYLRLLAEFDLGAERRPVTSYPYLVGANMAFRRGAFERFGLLTSQLTRQGTNLMSMDDTEFCHRVVKGGGTLVYEPRALVRHVVPQERARFSFLLRRSYANGRSLCRLKSLHTDLDAESSQPRALVRAAADLLRELPRRNSAKSARLAAAVAWHLGYLREARLGPVVSRSEGLCP